RRHPRAGEQLREVDLVAAAEDRARVVDHRDAERLRPLRETEGGQIRPGQAAQEERVVLRDPVEIAESDAGHAQALTSRDALETVERRGVGGLEGIAGVEEDGERGARLLALGRRALREHLASAERVNELIPRLGFQLLERQRLEVEELIGAVDLREAQP